MNEHSGNFNEETEKIRKYQIRVRELKNTITVLKNKLAEFNCTVDGAEEKNRRALKLTQSEQEKN